MKLKFRNFKLNEDLALRLSNRAVFHEVNRADLIRKYINEFPSTSMSALGIETTNQYRFEGIYLAEKELDILDYYSVILQMTKGQIFRAAIAQGLGIGKKHGPVT